MTYRNFSRPAFATGSHTTADWLTWMQEQGDVLMPVAPRHGQSCTDCFGASGYVDGGPQTWPRCFPCRAYGGAVDWFVPITYCIDSGLESMLHRYKDFAGYRWLHQPLSALLHEFLATHDDCIERAVGGVDVATIVPSDNTARAFSHLDGLLRGVWQGDPLLDRFDWNVEFLTRDRTVTRPPRKQLRPEAYSVAPSVVEGSNVLLLDDLWTSGSSAASAAAALKQAGASSVAVVTLGRQLTPGHHYGSTDDIYGDVQGEAWLLDDCVLCT